MYRTFIFISIFSLPISAFGDGGTRAIPLTLTTMEDIVRYTLAHSPELQASRLELQRAELAEPLFLSDLDTQIESGYRRTIDESPRAAPAFEGTRSEVDTFNVALSQKTLIGTEMRLSWFNERIANDTVFRTLDPSVDSILGLSIKQNLLRYFWGRPDVARRERYRADAIAAGQNVRQQTMDLAAGVVRAVLNVEFATERIKIAEEAVTTASKLVGSYAEKKRYGLIEASDEIQATTSLQAEETELLLARSEAVTARHALREYVGSDENINISTSTAVLLEWPGEARSTEEALLWASQYRGDLKALEALAKAAEWAARSEVLETLPELSVNASYGGAGLAGNTGRAWDDLNGFDHPIKSVGVNLTSPLLYRKEKILRKNKKLEWDLAQERLISQQRRVEREVRDAFEILNLSRERLIARGQLVELQRKKYAAERDNFRRGRSSTDLLVRFLQDISRNEITYLGARLQTQQAQVEMARATGTLLAKLGLEKNQ